MNGNMDMATPQFTDQAVARAFTAYAPAQRQKLLLLRELILQTARQTTDVGHIDEALRWQQPSYLTSETGSGSTIRIDAVRGRTQNYAMYFNCNTTLVDDFKQLYPKRFVFEGNRAIILDVADKLPTAELRHCISLALTYHLRKATKKNQRK